MTWPLKGESAGERNMFRVVIAALVLLIIVQLGMALYRGSFDRPQWMDKQEQGRR